MSPLLLLAFVSARAADPLLDPLQAELERSAAELALPDAPPPHALTYVVHDLQVATFAAELGGLLSDNRNPDRALYTQARAGDARFDSANFRSGWERPGFERRQVVLDPLPHAVRHDAWRDTDSAYKAAVDNLARRRAARRRRAGVDDTPSFAAGPPQQHDGGTAPPHDADALRALTISLSAVFRDYPALEWSRVDTLAEAGRVATLDSLGTRVVQPHSDLAVLVAARARDADGNTLVDGAQWVVRRIDQLPSEAEMAAEIRTLAERLSTWRDQPRAEEEHIGPVVFEGPAAALLVEHALIPALQGTPPPEKPPKGSRVYTFGDNEGARVNAWRVRRRLLPPGWRVTDDPMADPESPAFYRFDHEGEPAQAITLVDDGIVRTHFASRTPSEAVPQSNGHARGDAMDVLRGTAASLRIEPPKRTRDARLHRQAIDLARAYDLDHYVVVRRLQDPALSSMDGGARGSVQSAWFGEGGGGTMPIVEAARVFADGREEPVTGWSLPAPTPQLFRDVQAAGATTTHTLLVSPPAASASRGLELSTDVSVPAMLIGEVELVPGLGGGEPPSRLPPPLAEVSR